MMAQKSLVNVKGRGGIGFELEVVSGNFSSSLRESSRLSSVIDDVLGNTTSDRVDDSKCGAPRCRCRRLFLRVLRRVRSIWLSPDSLFRKYTPYHRLDSLFVDRRISPLTCNTAVKAGTSFAQSNLYRSNWKYLSYLRNSNLAG